jgi:hypothetical protein
MSGQPGSDNIVQSRLLNRRHFLKAAGSAAIFPVVLPAYAKQSASFSANNRINIGVIGMGWQGPGNTKSFLALDDCQVVAACDIDANHLRDAVKMINDTYGTADCKSYHDYRELLARPDIDAVMLAVPDHWHEIVATEAARHKKDIYAEKPWRTRLPNSNRLFVPWRRMTLSGRWARGSGRFRRFTKPRKLCEMG